MWTTALMLAVTVAQYSPSDLLLKAKARVVESLRKTPRYMCTQTVERKRYEPEVRAAGGNTCDSGLGSLAHAALRTRLDTSDRLRLDVTIGAAGEMYSWVGEQRFNDGELVELVKEGAISNGSFAAILTGVFWVDDANFTYNGDIEGPDGTTLIEYGFNVPAEKSKYTYGQGQHAVITGYEGTFRVNPRTADLVGLTLNTFRLPRQTNACHATTMLEYAPVPSFAFLLAKTSQLTITHADGGYSENRTTFANCHEFRAESKLSFEDAPAAAEAKAAKLATQIPAGLAFRVVIEQGIDTATAAVGDALKARLLTPIRNGQNTLVESGTPLTVRITRIRIFHQPKPSVALDVRLDRLNLGGVQIALAAMPAAANYDAFAKSRPKSQLQRRVPMGTLRGLDERATTFVFRDVSVPYPISSGLESTWITQ